MLEDVITSPAFCVMNNNNRKIVSVILAAGKGSRMRSPHLHKVCFQVNGKPVITNSIETYDRCGIDSHYIVVGESAEQVMQAASSAPGNLFFCHQTEQLGTGNAGGCAAKLLEAMDYQDDVLIVAGDKVIDESILQRFIDGYYAGDYDLSIIVGDECDFPGSGKIICDEDSNVLGNIEAIDIAKMQLLSALRELTNEGEVSAKEAERMALSYLKNEKKAALALNSLWSMIKFGTPVSKEVLESNFSESDFSIQLGDKNISADNLPDFHYSNLSVYLIKAPLLYSAIKQLKSDNAQHEEYLTDIIGILAAEGCKIGMEALDYPQQVMAFNTPEELKAIEDYFAGRKSVSVKDTPRTVRLASEWVRSFESYDGEAYKYLLDIYGDKAVAERKSRLLTTMLRSYVSRFSDEPVIITRAPGRVNIMGRHTDHQGGYANLIAIDRDLYLVVGAREDRKVMLHNMRSRDIPGRSFDTDDVIADYDGSDWSGFVDSTSIRDKLDRAPGDWSHYVIAPIARFQTKYPHVQIKGMNIVAAGDVPMAAGLSSSSALVVAVAEAIAHINDMEISPEQFVKLCGEGEWYVGTRGGSVDHAAMKFAQSGRVVHVSFLPFRMIDNMPFPTDYLFVVCNSQLKAHKTLGAKDAYNHRRACYSIGRELFKLEYPEYAPKIEHIRDINVSNLGVDYPDLLEKLKKLPCQMSREDIIARLPIEQSTEFLLSHADMPEGYPIRNIVMYGIAECERGRHCAELLRNKKIDEFGRVMNISHDGDRIVSWKSDGSSTPAIADYSDLAMDKLIENAKRGCASAELAYQPGSYSCSTPQIDKMIDIALADETVLGAQILGAGLGGCILVLIPKDSYPQLEERMIREYYEPMKLIPEMFPCRPVAGSQVVFF